MCHKGTCLFRIALAVLPAMTLAQTPAQLDWRRIGNSAVDISLASPATGPVDSVWFAADGSRLFARIRSGRIYETIDFENWSAAESPSDAPRAAATVAVDHTPESSSRLVSPIIGSDRVYALGKHLYRSDDRGRSWTNLSAYRDVSVIGGGQRSLAVSPNDPDQLVIANDYGVWRTLDGGLSWSGLNQGLPNLPVQHFATSGSALRVVAAGFGAIELATGTNADWRPAAPEPDNRERYAAVLGARVTSYAVAGDTVYAGTADGRVWASLDRGRTWGQPSAATGGAVEAIFADPAEPRIALAALSGPGPHVLRTTNSGGFWDDLTANLTDAPAHGIAANRAAGAVYVATDKGVFSARADLENPGPASSWTLLTGALPNVPALDVRLDRNGYQLYILLDGYGVYAAPAPHRRRTLSLVSAADFTARAAAPGSLVSVLGGRVESATAGEWKFPVLAASDTESQIQVPFEASGPALSLNLEAAAGRFSLPLPVQPVAPAIFVGRDGAPMLLDADSGLMLDARNAARSNSRVQVFATGLGKVKPEWPTGMAAPLENPPAVNARVQAFLDRTPVAVTRATLAPGYIGFYLIELQLPALVNAGPAELYLAADGQESNRVTVYLEP